MKSFNKQNIFVCLGFWGSSQWYL